MNNVRILVIMIIVLFSSCEKDDQDPEYQCKKGNPNIVGAKCNDGSRSDATGQGACSRHGGVNYWLCR